MHALSRQLQFHLLICHVQIYATIKLFWESSAAHEVLYTSHEEYNPPKKCLARNVGCRIKHGRIPDFQADMNCGRAALHSYAPAGI